MRNKKMKVLNYITYFFGVLLLLDSFLRIIYTNNKVIKITTCIFLIIFLVLRAVSDYFHKKRLRASLEKIKSKK